MEWRLRELRRLLGITEKEWNRKLNIVRKSAAADGHPYGDTVEDQISLISHTFGIEENWLWHGIGPVRKTSQ